MAAAVASIYCLFTIKAKCSTTCTPTTYNKSHSSSSSLVCLQFCCVEWNCTQCHLLSSPRRRPSVLRWDTKLSTISEGSNLNFDDRNIDSIVRQLFCVSLCSNKTNRLVCTHIIVDTRANYILLSIYWWITEIPIFQYEPILALLALREDKYDKCLSGRYIALR